MSFIDQALNTFSIFKILKLLIIRSLRFLKIEEYNSFIITCGFVVCIHLFILFFNTFWCDAHTSISTRIRVFRKQNICNAYII